MPDLERFLYTKNKKKSSEIKGLVSMKDILLDTAISTRPFLTSERMLGRRRRTGQEHPLIINFSKLDFVIDGHHKIRRALESGQIKMLAQVLTITDRELGTSLLKQSKGFVKNLPIR